jgi:hypothetical protein
MKSYHNEEERGNPLPFTLQGKIPLYHYTTEDFGDIAILDPIEAKKRFNYYSLNDYKRTDVPRIFYYTDLAQTEKMITKHAKSLYMTYADGDRIFDINEAIFYYRNNQSSLKQLSPKIYEIIDTFIKMGGMNYQYLFEKIKEHYDGIYYVSSFPIVNMFIPLEVKKIEL